MGLATFKRKLRRRLAPISSDALRRALDTVTSGGHPILYVHSGISGVGHFRAGPESVASGLREFCDTLFQPTHSYNYPPSPDQPAPVFDAATTPSQLGLFSEMFRKMPGVIRSIHSTHSIAAEGRLAADFCAGHYEQDTPCGLGTPYSRVVHAAGAALMFGVDFTYYTPFHTAEWESGSAFAYEPEERNLLRFLDENGVLRERLRMRQNRIVPRFQAAGVLLEQQGFVRRVPLGRSYLLCVPDMLKAHDFLVERLRKVPDFLRSTCTAELV